ncbi:unnamed protein product [Moneuplotes crassus]|uniref:RING-type domain-containing protein n=1 Tax=Euplotes crassus TaxID=5936 RepID=A0AAD1X149_EUPCR|nr:unnamed protein product [Moneuplotes crassus]
MVISLFLLLFLLCARTESCNGQIQSPEFRSLEGPPIDCYIKTTCSSCNAETTCYWTDEYCTDLDPDEFMQEYYDEYMADENCAEYSESTIDLTNVLGETIELKHNTGNDISWFMCQWTIKTDTSKSIEITISRNDQTYEEIGLNYTLRGTLISVDNKDLTSCGENTYSLKFDNNISEIIVRTRTRRDQNDYDILIAQEGKDLGTPNVLTNNKKLVEIIAVLVVATFVIIIVVLITFALCKRTGNISKNKFKRVKKHMNKLAEEKEVNTDEVMDNMLSGKFQNISHLYKTSSCLICLIKFIPDDMCHLTNECGHLFHSHCLKKWYNMVSHMSDLACPKCQTPTTSKLHQPLEEIDKMDGKDDELYHSRSQLENEEDYENENAKAP